MAYLSQTKYGIFNAIAMPGQLADVGKQTIRSFIANELIQPGVALELAADGFSVQQVQGTTASANNSYATGGASGALVLSTIIGFSVLRTAREGAGAFNVTPYGVGGVAYQIGEEVPVLIEGGIYAAWLLNGALAQPGFASGSYNASSTGYLQVAHSTTVATNRGWITTGQANGTTTFSPAGQNIRSRYPLPTAGGVILVDFTTPGAI
jgi:hypothetical protein